MSRLKVHCFSISLDGFGAGPNQSLQNPLGEGGEELHRWFFGTRTFQRMVGNASGGSDDAYVVMSFRPAAERISRALECMFSNKTIRVMELPKQTTKRLL